MVIINIGVIGVIVILLVWNSFGMYKNWRKNKTQKKKQDKSFIAPESYL